MCWNSATPASYHKRPLWRTWNLSLSAPLYKPRKISRRGSGTYLWSIPDWMPSSSTVCLEYSPYRIYRLHIFIPLLHTTYYLLPDPRQYDWSTVIARHGSYRRPEPHDRWGDSNFHCCDGGLPSAPPDFETYRLRRYQAWRLSLDLCYSVSS